MLFFKRKHGCLRTLFFLIVIVVLFSILGFNALNDITILGINKKAYDQCVKELNKPVNVNNLVSDPLVEENKTTLLAKLTAADLNVYNTTNDTIELNKSSYSILSQLTLSNKELSVFLNLALKNDPKNIFELASINLTPIENKKDEFSFKTVTILNLIKPKESVPVLKDLPNKIYITTISDITINANKLAILSSNTIIINELKDSPSAKDLITIVENVLKAIQSNINLNNFLNLNYLNMLNDLSLKGNFEYKLAQDEINFLIKA